MYFCTTGFAALGSSMLKQGYLVKELGYDSELLIRYRVIIIRVLKVFFFLRIMRNLFLPDFPMPELN